MTVEVHRAVEDPNDLKRLPFDRKEDDVLLVSGRAAAFCEVLPQPAGIRVGLDFGERPPKDLSNSDLPVPHPKSEACSRKSPANLELPRARG
jgi:hypothetical protein